MDETQPLLPDADSDQLPKLHGANVVDFDPDGDAENPQEWPRTYKWGIVALLASTAFTVTFTCISVVPVANRIVSDLNHGQSSKSASVLLVTIWELGEAAGPLLIAPLSEVYGRYPVMNAANILFISATVLAALCQSTPLFIAARALTGLAVASNVLSPAIVGDMFISEQRGTAMSYIMLAPLVGGAVGPAIAGAIAQSLGWRKVLWMSAILAGLCEILFLFCSRETYKVAVLRRRAAKLREETGNKSVRTAYDDENESDSRKFWNSIMRPAVVFSDSIVLQMLAIYGSLAFSYFYVMSTTLPDILEGLYHLSPALTGSSFICFSIGSTVSLVIVNLLLDRIYIKLREAHKGIEQPEHRLPLVIVGAFSMPFVIALYGWIPALGLPLPLMLICLGTLGATMLLAFMPLMAYVVDAFKLYSASALTALIVVRCLVGTFLPLITEPLIKGLGYGWGFTVLCAASFCVAPIPVLVFRYGAKWRQRSTYTKEE
ncbi:MFS transporter [Exophiala viscosa]|uniref:MFS transporter n=1 Tax=Exophiala viscosa TaxID=2486360 RepID=UPI0021A21977|nr:MFS transporter [Exophiala viscosa]